MRNDLVTSICRYTKECFGHIGCFVATYNVTLNCTSLFLVIARGYCGGYKSLVLSSRVRHWSKNSSTRPRSTPELCADGAPDRSIAHSGSSCSCKTLVHKKRNVSTSTDRQCYTVIPAILGISLPPSSTCCSWVATFMCIIGLEMCKVGA